MQVVGSEIADKFLIFLLAHAMRSVPRFIQAELTLFIIQRRKFQERTAFAPRKGFEMLCKFKEASK